MVNSSRVSSWVNRLHPVYCACLCVPRMVLYDPGVAHCMMSTSAHPFNCRSPRMEKIIPLNSTQFKGIKRSQTANYTCLFREFYTFSLYAPRASFFITLNESE
jgi:hypothetical protein